MSKFLDSTGVSYLMGLIKTAISNKKASVTDSNPTLSWGAESKVGTVDGTDLNVTMPSNPNTDTTVDSAAHHYTPSRDTNADKSASASGATAAWSIDVVKGVTVQTDGKGHVTGVAVTSGKVPGNPNTDRYVNSASFAHDSTNDNVKMTLTRAGSDSVTVTGNIPKVSSSSAGVVPKGAAVSSQSQSTKFLREDGTWAEPSYTTNTDTKVTAVGNHYTPSTSSNTTKSASGGTVAGAGTEVQVVTGVIIDAAGHVTGVTSEGVKNTTPVTSVAGKTGAVTLVNGDVGLENVTNDAQVKRTEMGAANGVATLGSDGKVPSSQLPSYVDDVVEGYYKSADGKFYESKSGTTYTTLITGEAGKVYVDKDTNQTFRCSNTTDQTFTPIKGDLALGETSSTAYRGDRGKTAYDHSQSTHARTDATKTEASSTNGYIKINGTDTKVYEHPSYTAATAAAKKVGLDALGHVVLGDALTKSDVGLGNVGNFKAVSTEATQNLSSTEKSNARANIGAGTSSFSGSYNDLSNKPTIPTVNNGVFSVMTKVGTASAVKAADFSANQSSDDDITFVQGSNVTLTTDASSRTITIAATDTTYSAATQSANGLMSSTDKTKLDGIATGATAVTETTVAGWGFTKNTGTITSHQTIKQNAITGATGNDYCSCSTAASTAAKTASVTAGTPTLEAGLHVFVKFANKNTASNPTLNINSKGAKAIWYDGAAIATDAVLIGLLDGLCEFEYDGTQWHLVNKTAALSSDDIDTLWSAA